MVDFSTVIPFYWVIPFAFAIIYGAILFAKMYRWAKAVGKTSKDPKARFYGYFTKLQTEKKAEGIFWYFSEMTYAIFLGFVLLAGYRLFSYLFLLPPDVSIFDEILGELTVPVVTVILTYFTLKTVPYAIHKSKGDQIV